ncbi:hypothetical protein Q5H92_23465 [Hymenobacter sp. M29]|uniref:Uncharacterized protein n=1 Tax=Hymenobacter mellowenesis TaxID=3063995 RepID=A0ABT9AHJ7_9BACT|nr:hypothetical protein [Hymenobacter sp. M29]MDO7849342.1 hypothetical protein [Hymenobacter sp. M29]
MDNEQLNLNTEPNDIAGNRIDGPVGNTATQHTAPGAGVGQPGGPPASQKASNATPDVSSPAAPASSESLADSETSVGEGAVEANPKPQENKEADPADLAPEGAYGGNFSNSTQDSFNDQARRDNQDSAAARGEFGAQGEGGNTHGGFGNQNRLADYEPRSSAEDKYYGGPGAPGPQDNAYRDYDGHDQRPDARTEYGFEAGNTVSLDPSAKTADTNDNGSPKGTDSGYASDYGHTSLRSAASSTPQGDAAGLDRRNQTEDYMPAPASPANATAGTANPEAGSQHSASGQGYGDRGRNQPNETANPSTGDARNGYNSTEVNKGDENKGIGSKGGSYNDQYDDSQPNSRAGSPAKGEERTEDRAQNYGQEARQENRAGEDNAADHGAPNRNAGRDGEKDE